MKGRGLGQCWHSIKRGDYLILILDHKGGGVRVKNLGKSGYMISKFSDYVIRKLISI